jgi:hypothetical protein
MQIARLLLAAAVCLVFAIGGAMPAAAHAVSTAADALPDYGTFAAFADREFDITDDDADEAPQAAPDTEAPPVFESTELLVAVQTDYLHTSRMIC